MKYTHSNRNGSGCFPAKLNVLFAACVLAMTGVPATAQDAEFDGEAYICELKSFSQIGWIPPKLALFLDQEKSTGYVYDGYVEQTVGEPLEAQVTKRGKGKWNFSWEIKDFAFTGGRRGSSDVEYSANFDVSKKKVTMSAVLSGMDGNAPRGRGTCELHKS